MPLTYLVLFLIHFSIICICYVTIRLFVNVGKCFLFYLYWWLSYSHDLPLDLLCCIALLRPAHNSTSDLHWLTPTAIFLHPTLTSLLHTPPLLHLPLFISSSLGSVLPSQSTRRLIPSIISYSTPHVLQFISAPYLDKQFSTPLC